MSRRRWLLGTALTLGGVFLTAFLVTLWLVASTGGASLLLAAAGLKATGLEGSLLGPLRAQAIELRRPYFLVIVERADFDWSPMGLLRGRFQVTHLNADAISIATAPAKERAKMPLTLEPPLTIRIEHADVKQVRLGTLAAGGAWTPGFEMTDFALRSVAGSAAWVFESIGAQTAAGRLDARGSIGAVHPFPIEVTAQLSGTREGRKYRLTAIAKGTLGKFDAQVRGAEGGVTGEARIAVEPYEKQPLRRVRGKLEGIDTNAFAPAAPHTKITVEADLVPTREGGLAGPAQIVNLDAGPIDRQRVPIAQARGQLRIEAPRYELTQATIGFAGGGGASGQILIDGTRAHAKLAVSALDLAAWHANLRPTKLNGEIVADTTAEAQRFQVRLAEPRFEIAGRAAIEKQRLTVEEAHVTRGASGALIRGAMDLQGARAFDFAATLEHVDPAAFAQGPAGDLSGKLRVKGTARPTLAAELLLELGESRLAGLPLAGHANVAGDAKRIARADVNLTLANARLQAQGAYGRTGEALDVTFEATDLAPIAKAFKREFAGSVNVRGRLAGTFEAPGGTLSANAQKLRLPGGIAMASAVMQLDVGGQADSRADGRIEVTNLTRPAASGAETLAERATVTIAGTRSQHRAALEAHLPFERRLAIVPTATPLIAPATPSAPAAPQAQRLQIVLQGGLVDKAAAPTWKGRIESASIRGPNPLTLTAPATLTLARDRVEIGEAVVKGDIGQARFALTRWSPTRIEARGSSDGLLTRPIVRALGLPAQARSNLVLAAEWDVQAAQTLDGFVRVRRVRGDVQLGEPPVALGIEELTLTAEAARGQVKAALAVRGAKVGRILANVTTAIGRDAGAWALPVNAPLAGDIDADVPSLVWASDWFGPDARLEGRVKGRVALGGTLGTPTYRGNVAADGLQLREPTLGFEIDEGRAAIALNEREVVIERFELASAWRVSRRADRRLEGVEHPAKGTIGAEGRIDFATRTGTITVRSQAYPVTQLPGRFIAATGEARLEAREKGVNVAGRFRADAGFFGIAETAPPTLSDDVLVDRGEGLPDARERQRLTVDLRFDLGENLHFSGRGLATHLVGDVRLRGEPGRSLVSSGQIRTLGGTYDAYGQKLAIERGVLAFQGPVDNPGLNVLAVREGLPVVAGVEILGTVARPKVRLYSRPDVPDHEKLSWLVLGRGPAQASEGDAATLFAAANALLGANRENRRLLSQIGFDEVTIGRGGTTALGALPQSTIAGRTGTSGGAEVFTVGKRLGKDLYVSYQHSLADAAATLRFTYQVTKKLQVLLRAGDNPGVDAVYRFTFD